VSRNCLIVALWNRELRMDSWTLIGLAVAVVLALGSVVLFGQGQMYFGAILLGIGIFIVWRLIVRYFMKKAQEPPRL